MDHYSGEKGMSTVRGSQRVPKGASLPRGRVTSGEGPTPLHIATQDDDVVLLRVLLRQNLYNVDSRGEDNLSALHMAANAGKLEVWRLHHCHFAFHLLWNMADDGLGV